MNNLNIDHRRTFEAVMTACRPQPEMKNPDIYSFYIQSSTDWIASTQATQFIPNVFVDVGDEIEQKLEALKAYKIEMREYPHSRLLELMEVFAQYWGTILVNALLNLFFRVRSVSKHAN